MTDAAPVDTISVVADLGARVTAIERNCPARCARADAATEALRVRALATEADLVAIRASLRAIEAQLVGLADLRLDVTGLQAYVYRGSAAGAAAGGGGGAVLVACAYALAKAMGWIH